MANVIFEEGFLNRRIESYSIYFLCSNKNFNFFHRRARDLLFLKFTHPEKRNRHFCDNGKHFSGEIFYIYS